MKNKAEKGAGFASRSLGEGLGDEYMKNKAERGGLGGEYMQPEKMVNCTMRKYYY